jgi:hypothetical protein
MTWTVIAQQRRASGSIETRYARTFSNEARARLHADAIRSTWVDPSVEIVVEEGGPFRLIETKGDNDE